ncbi:MAG: TSUP family transporter, partial [Rhodobacteraceae bacterium]|nr:TSUP family transporter [Paracoccaceae bacterium]
MEFVLADMSLTMFMVACGIAFIAGVVKGMVGFAMPMILISGLSSIMAPELALAGLIVPTLVTNGMQSLRQGVGAAAASVRKFRVFLGAGFVMLLVSAQFVRVLPGDVMLLIIGVPVTVFVLIQLAGVHWHLEAASARLEIAIGGFAGIIGGLSGVWGPPTVLYLTALNTEKTEQIRVQGVIYGLGAVALFVAHIVSGVLGV